VADTKGDELARLSGFFEVPLPSAVADRIDQFWALLLRWNERINLTGAATRDELVSEHLPDSFALARLVPHGASLADVGAGGGLPALPFALLRPDVRLTMFESRAKRSAFLRTAVRELKVPDARIGGPFTPASWMGVFDVAASRATFAPEEWLDQGHRVVRRGGVVVVFTGGGEVVRAGGGEVADVVEYETGRGHRRRAVAFRST
jgi:16S rRNA (guanine527-N7)-methyltransferase